MPRVSVIIPTYNRRELVLEAVDSVLNQTYQDFELIVMDDGSSDGTKNAAQERHGNRLMYVYQEHQGVSAARNHGMELARGEYIAFLDSDDLWLPRKLEVQIDFMHRHSDAQICYTDEVWIRQGVRVNPRRRHAKHTGWIYPYCLPLCIISPSSACMRRELFDRVGVFDTDLPVCEDYDLWLRVASRFPIFFLDRKLIIKRGGHADQLSNRSWGNDRYRVVALEKQLSLNHLTSGEHRATVEMLRRKCLILANGFFKRGNMEAGIQYRDLAEKWGQGIQDGA